MGVEMRKGAGGGEKWVLPEKGYPKWLDHLARPGKRHNQTRGERGGSDGVRHGPVEDPGP